MDLLPVIIVPLPKSNVEKEENGERREKGGICEMKMRGIGTYHQPFLLIGGHILIQRGRQMPSSHPSLRLLQNPSVLLF